MLRIVHILILTKKLMIKIFKVGGYLRIFKYENIFAKGYTPNWSDEAFVVSKIKNTVPWTYIINDLNGEEITVTF